MSPLLRSQSCRPLWWFQLVDLRFGVGCLLLMCLIVMERNPRLQAEPQREGVSKSAEQKPIPPYREIEGALEDFFKQDANYRPGDLITREQGENFLKILPVLGWKLKETDQKALLEKMLPTEHFLVQEYRTKQGMRFMRKISAMPGGYDRTHRLTGLKGGKDRLKELIRDQGGYQFIEYLTKADGGKNLGLMLGSVKGGKDFNSPTGFLYTENALAGKLRELHNRDLADEAKKAQGASQ